MITQPRKSARIARFWGKPVALNVASLLAIAALAAGLLAMGASQALASAPADRPGTTIVVNSLGDLPDNNPADGICQTDVNDCTLRAAIQTAQGGALPGADTIDLSTISGMIYLSFGVLPAITEDLSISGPSSASTVVINALGETQHFQIQPGVTVDIADVFLYRGFGSLGGSIYNQGDLTLTDVIIATSLAIDDGGAIYSASGSTTTIQYSTIGQLELGNSAQYGGAIYNDTGTVNLIGSYVGANDAVHNGGAIHNYNGNLNVDALTVIEDNHAGDYGGGVYNVASGVARIEDSTLTGNWADADGGGIYNFYSILTLINSTVSGNSAHGDGGGIVEMSTDSLYLYNVTITDNVADSESDGLGNGGGLFAQGTVYMTNSVLAGNLDQSTSTALVHPDCSSWPSTIFPINAYNVVGNNAGCTAYFVNGVNGNQVGTPTSPLDPVLGPLELSGSALVHALLADSPAIDAGDPTGCKDDLGTLLETDQRGIGRPQNDRCDVGAYEAAWPSVTEQTFSVVEFSPNGTVVGTVVANDPNLGSPLSYAITGGNGTGSGAFAIGLDDGQLTVADSSQVNSSVHPDFPLSVTVTNTIGLTDTAIVTVDVLPSPLVVRTTNDSGPGSLRAAMLYAESNSGFDTIIFDIPGAGPHVITPTSPLPNLFDLTTIDGSTQPAGEVVIDGSLAGPLTDGFVTYNYATRIRSLTITNFGGSGVNFANTFEGAERGGFLNLVENSTITGNGGNGISLDPTQYATIRANDIYSNGLLGIDLGDDGVTPNDVGDPDPGANLQQNYPVLLRAVPGEGNVGVEGRFNSLPGASFTLDYFASTACDPSNFGEGEHYLGSASVDTDADGNARFAHTVSAPDSDEIFITATATGPTGMSSEFSQCITVGPANDSWPRAYRLDLFANHTTNATFSQYVDKLGQSRWFKFRVQPDSKVTVELTNLPANYDIVIYKDIAQVYADLTNPQNQADLEKLNAEFAPDMFAPDMFAPDMFAPDMFAPDMFAPDMFAPDMFAPDMFAPDMFAPDMFAPDMFAPDMFAPDMFAPDEHYPNAFDPDNFDPNAPVVDPQAYASAQNRSIIAFSSRTGTADERAVVNTWTRTGDFYVRVRGRNGVFSLAAPYTLNVSIELGLCQNLDTTLVPGTLLGAAGNYHSIILVDPTRMDGSPAQINAMLAKLNQLAARPEVQGVVVDVSQDARVAAANLQADQKVDCPEAKNLVAEATKQIIQRYEALNPLEYVVIVGNDDVIPFFRAPDQASLASEINYVPPVFNGTQSQSSLRLGYMLTQEPYGSAVEISFKNHTIPVPNLAVGRLVETPNEVTHLVDAYLATNGVVATPSSAFVSGYDFLADAAVAVQAELESGIGQPASTLIAPRDQAPQDPNAWTGDQLKAAFLGSRHDLVFLAGHFSAATALAADFTTRMTTQDVLSSTVNLENSIIFSAGCHSGYNIVNGAAVPYVTREPDWAQTFARKGATLIAGTGYQYGDTDFVEYSERLYLEFAKHLRYGTGPVALGKALVGAKQTYLANTPRMRGIHEKSLLEATLFGLPMLKVDLPFGRIDPPVDPPVIPGVADFTHDPGLTLGLKFADLTVTPDLTEVTRVLSDTTALSNRIFAIYLEGSDGVAINPVEPVLPLETRNVTVLGQTLRGIGFRSGSYADEFDIVPLTSAPATEVRGIHFPFRSQTFYPTRGWDANYFDALATPSGGDTKLVVMPAQFLANDPVGIQGTLRKYNSMDFRLYYSDNVASYPDVPLANVPSLAGPPEIAQVTSITDTNTVSFTVQVTSDPSAGVQEVWVTYTGSEGPFYGSWQSLDLVQDANESTQWKGVLSLPAAQRWNDVRFIAQAVNGVGLVTLVSNFGAYFTPGVDPGQTPNTGAPTTMTLISPPTSGPYGTLATFTARLETGPVEATGIPGQIIEFSFGSQRRLVVTDGAGQASVAFPLIGLIGPEQVQASFAGNADYGASSTGLSFTITKQSTSIEMTPEPTHGQYSDDTDLQATLFAGADRRLPQRSIFFVAGNLAESLSATSTSITDYAGRAPGWAIDLPAGTYPLAAYFLGTVPIGGGQTVTLTDSRFLASIASGTLIQTAEDATVIYTGETAVQSNQPLLVSAQVTQADDGSPGDLARAQVRYILRNSDNQVVADVTNNANAGGVSSTTINGLANGSYTLTIQVVGGYFSSPVSDPIAIQVGAPAAVSLSQLSAGDPPMADWRLAALLAALGSVVAGLAIRRRSVVQAKLARQPEIRRQRD